MGAGPGSSSLSEDPIPSWKAYGLSEWGSTPPSCPWSLRRSPELPAPDTQMSLTAAQHLIPRQRTSYLRSVHGALWGRSMGRGDLNLLHLPSGEVIADRNTCLAAVESCGCLVCALVCVWCWGDIHFPMYLLTHAHIHTYVFETGSHNATREPGASV